MSIFGDLCRPNQASSDPEIIRTGLRCDEQTKLIREFTTELVQAISQQTTALINSCTSLIASFRAEIRQWISQQINLQNQILVSVRDSLSAQTAIAFNELVLQLQLMGLPVSNPYDIANETNNRLVINADEINTNRGNDLPNGRSADSAGLRTDGEIANETRLAAGAVGANNPFGLPGQVASGGTTNDGSVGLPGRGNEGLGAAGTLPGDMANALPLSNPSANYQSRDQPVTNLPGGLTTGPAVPTNGIGERESTAFAGPVVNSAALATAEATGGQVSGQSLSNAIAGAIQAILQMAGSSFTVSNGTVVQGSLTNTVAISLPQFLNTIGLTAEQLCQLPSVQQEQVLTGYGQVLQGMTAEQPARDFPVDLNQPLAWNRWGGNSVAWRRSAARMIGGDGEAILFPVTFPQGLESLDRDCPPVDTWPE